MKAMITMINMIKHVDVRSNLIENEIYENVTEFAKMCIVRTFVNI